MNADVLEEMCGWPSPFKAIRSAKVSRLREEPEGRKGACGMTGGGGGLSSCQSKRQ